MPGVLALTPLALSAANLSQKQRAGPVDPALYTKIHRLAGGPGAGFATLGMQNSVRRRNYFVNRTVLCQNCFQRSFFWRRISERLITSPINNG